MLLFAFGDFAFNIFWQSVMLYLLFYYTDALDIPIKVAATTYMIASVWDGLASFAVGVLGGYTTFSAFSLDTVLSGTVVGQFREGIRLIDIQVRQPLAERQTIEILNNTNVPTASGRSVPISQLARVDFVWEPGVVWRLGREWAITVQADVVEGIQGPTVSGQINPAAAARSGNISSAGRAIFSRLRNCSHWPTKFSTIEFARGTRTDS